nr:carbohydrate kinase [Virgisporangium aliadipatigenens]
MRYAVVLGEALMDLLDGTSDGEPVYRPAVGGAPFNVAVGVSRLGGAAHFVGSVSTDALGERLLAFLVDNGVRVDGVKRVAAPTTLALTTFTDAEPDFTFYGDSHGLLGPDDLDAELLAGAEVISAGSIAMLWEPTLAAARAAWRVPGPRKVFDPNARPRLLQDRKAYAAVVEEFAAGADLVKLSAVDAEVLWGDDPERAAARLAEGGATVVVTRGGSGALLRHDHKLHMERAEPIEAVDTTGAGDSVLAALVHGMLTTPEGGTPDWPLLLRYALAVGSLTCEGPGGATALPTADAVRRRFPQAVPYRA